MLAHVEAVQPAGQLGGVVLHPADRVVRGGVRPAQRLAAAARTPSTGAGRSPRRSAGGRRAGGVRASEGRARGSGQADLQDGWETAAGAVAALRSRVSLPRRRWSTPPCAACCWCGCASGLGDLLCTVPAVRALRAVRPDLHVALATWPEMAGVVGRLGAWVDELVAVPRCAGHPGAHAGRVPAVLAGRPARARLGPGAAGVRRQPGRQRRERRRRRQAVRRLRADPVDRAGPGPAPALPARAARGGPPPARCSSTSGCRPGRRATLAWPVTPQDEAGAAALGLPRGGYAVLHPGATSPSRLWPAGRFAGGRATGSSPQGCRWSSAACAREARDDGRRGRCLPRAGADLTGRTRSGAYAVLLRDAAVVVANDTGTAHLSAAVGGRVVTVFLSGDPVRWRHAPHLQAVVREDVGCNPCPHLVCPIDHRCATRISPERVLAEAAARCRERRPRLRAPSARR